MKNIVSCLVLSVGLIHSARSQDSIESIRREMLLQQLGDRSTEMDFAVAQRQKAIFRQREFIERVHRFVAAWERFAKEYNRQGTFNAKSARDVSKAFHELEKSEGWTR
jgi:hypothetical protein